MMEPMGVRHLALVTGNYPSHVDPSSGTFVRTFAHAIARQGTAVTVIQPIGVLSRRRGPYPQDEVETTETRQIRVVRPLFLSLGVRRVLGMGTAGATEWGFRSAVWRALRGLETGPSHVYGHFLYQAGRAAVWAGERLGIPSVVGVGEGAFWTIEPVGFERARKAFASASGFLAVSSQIGDGLVRELSVPATKILVAPNGVDRRRFKPTSQAEARQRLGWNPNQFLIAFVGTFDDLKGGRELIRAVERMDDVGLLLMGQGPEPLHSKRTVFKGMVRHADIPLWLSAADIFVLPTREEGSCNAVIEAMACGLPIITSNGRYMDDIVDDRVAIRVNPLDVTALRLAIDCLRQNPGRRRAMSHACICRATLLDVDLRAERVLRWMSSLRTTW